MPEPSSSIQPSLPPSTRRPFVHRVADVDLGRRLGEREIARPQAQHDVVALEKGLEEGLERPFQMAEVDAAVDHQPFDLVEHRRVGGVAVGAVGAARRDDADAAAAATASSGSAPARCGCAAASLAAPGRPSPSGAGEIEGVVHRPRRVALGDVERGEIVPVVLDLGPGRDREAQVGENLGELVHHLADRMDAALRRRRAGSVMSSVSVASRARARPPPAPPCARRSPRSPPRAGAWMRGPSLCRSSGVMPPSVLSRPVTAPCLPSAATRTASSAWRSPRRRCGRAGRSSSCRDRHLPWRRP